MTKHESDMARACAETMGWKKERIRWRTIDAFSIEYVNVWMAPDKTWTLIEHPNEGNDWNVYHPWLDDAVSLKQADELWEKLKERLYTGDIRSISDHTMDFEITDNRNYRLMGVGNGTRWNSALCEAVLEMKKGEVKNET